MPPRGARIITTATTRLLPSQRIRALIWGKTYPELSARHLETVCTGAVNEQGEPLRLYPVPLRYMEGTQQYSLYDWIEVDVERNSVDPRPESRKIRPESIARVGSISPSSKDEWRARREIVLADGRWQFDSIESLKTAQRTSQRSMGVLRVGEIVGVRVMSKDAEAERRHEAKRAQVTAPGDLFRPEYLPLEFVPFDVRLRFRCAGACSGCAKHPHDMKVLDWGLIELGRRDGPAAALARLTHIANLRTHDFRLFMGNFRHRMHNFGIIGLWYPKRAAQPLLL
jgi:hypothetical protein